MMLRGSDGEHLKAAAASAGGTGAPPDASSPNLAPSDLTREYSGEGIRVQWYASRCIHSADCIRALPRVFRPKRRPWIELEGADADAVADAVLRCPTGALHFVRTDGGPEEVPPDGVSIRAIKNGPYLVRGEIEIRDESGVLIRHDTRLALCRCGESRHMPFCDNTHSASGDRR